MEGFIIAAVVLRFDQRGQIVGGAAGEELGGAFRVEGDRSRGLI
jgi:hypothetical protein